MAKMTIDRAVHILSEASRGILTVDAEFKVACAMGKQALIKREKSQLRPIPPLPPDSEAFDNGD